MSGGVAGAGSRSAPFSFHVQGDDQGAWPAILSSVGLVEGIQGPATLYVLPGGIAVDVPEWIQRIERGAFVILEGESELAEALGFRARGRAVPVRRVVDAHNPKLVIVWEKTIALKRFDMPPEARVFAKERWEAIPLVAGLRRGAGAVLWLAVRPGEKGFERFPYLAQALADLGVAPPLASRRLWAFFDSSYRRRVDLDYFAPLWRRSGIAALHVAAWHYLEPDPERDAYLRGLMEACHRNAILVYAWLELPHVSEKFWEQHPDWREKTALLEDAHLDWRKLMNLSNPECLRAAAASVRGLIERFDWDGVNLAELYFESLEGHENAARFTPMNEDVRREFRSVAGFDPIELFDPAGPRHHSRNPDGLRAFLDYRAELAERLQTVWLTEMQEVRRGRPDLDLVLTHVDDRYDASMRDRLGADAARLLPLLARHEFTFLVEDPATLWHLGPDRYAAIAQRYRPLAPRPRKLAIDINIVERYQDVYPTKQQTGIELFQLVHTASRSFPRVALYFENSILLPDRMWLASASAVVRKREWAGDKLVVEAAQPVGVPWQGAAMVNGKLWPAADDSHLWLPAGVHAIEQAPAAPPVRLLDFSGDLKTAASLDGGLEIAYESDARAIAALDKPPLKLEVDGAPWSISVSEAGGRFLVELPRGQHLVSLRVQ